jgi:UDP-N-acetyl-D-glucosamine/UDP-N-acetyl-D-galactosamine dehydrogenase
VILAGRSINDSMPRYVANLAIKGLNKAGKKIRGSNILIMGLTYKENVADIRESPVTDMVHELREFGVNVYGYDPLLPESVIEYFGVKPFQKKQKKMDAVIISVAHAQFLALSMDDILGFMNKNPVVIDVRGMLDQEDTRRTGLYYKRL